MDKMREEFEAWIRKYESGSDPNEVISISLRQIKMIKLIAWQAAHESAVPDGYCVVPIKPTRDMVTSGNDAMALDCCTGDAGDAWYAMIANRPRL